MQAMVISNPRQAPFRTRERCEIRELANSDAIGDFSLAETRVAPGVTTERHALSVAEWYVLREGRGVVELGRDAGVPVAPGDIVQIPAHVAQRITNTGDGDLVFYCVCLPRFLPDCYRPVDPG